VVLARFSVAPQSLDDLGFDSALSADSESANEEVRRTFFIGKEQNQGLIVSDAAGPRLAIASLWG
jgi:hypothetical protein